MIKRTKSYAPIDIAYYITSDGKGLDLSLPNAGEIDYTDIDIALKFLQVHPQITFLDLGRHDWSLNMGKVIPIIAKNNTIIDLNLEMNNISNLGAFAQNTTLKKLDLYDCNLADNDVIALARNSSIMELNLGVNHSGEISDVGAIALARNKVLKKLNLHDNSIGADGAIALAQNSTLIELNLSNNVEVAYNRPDVGTAFARNSTLKFLYLSGCNLGDNIVITISKNTTLHTLHLVSNSITDRGASALAQNSTLVDLNLAHNKIGPKGAEALAKNTTLKSLELSYNNIGDKGATSFLNNYTLTNIGLPIYETWPGNNISGSVLIELKEHINKNVERLRILKSGRKKLRGAQSKIKAISAFTAQPGKPGGMVWAQELGRTEALSREYGRGIPTDIPKLTGRGYTGDSPEVYEYGYKDPLTNCLEGVYIDETGTLQHYTKDHLYFMATGLGLFPRRNRTKHDLCLLLTFDGGMLDCNNLNRWSKHDLQVIAEGYGGIISSSSPKRQSGRHTDITGLDKKELCLFINSKL